MAFDRTNIPDDLAQYLVATKAKQLVTGEIGVPLQERMIRRANVYLALVEVRL